MAQRISFPFLFHCALQIDIVGQLSSVAPSVLVVPAARTDLNKYKIKFDKGCVFHFVRDVVLCWEKLEVPTQPMYFTHA